MTEDEAKTKICHRVIDGEGVVTKDAPEWRCIGSRCNESDDYKDRVGYCGLAGKP